MAQIVRVEVNCATGEETRVTLSGKELADHLAWQAETTKAETAKRQQRNADLAAIKDKAKTDPAFAALVRHLGIQT